MRESKVQIKKKLKNFRCKNLWHNLLSRLTVSMLIMMLVVGCQQTDSTQTTPTQMPNHNASSSGSETQSKVRIHFIDTGNSDAILIEQGDHGALIDGGDNDDEELVVNYIKHLGISSLDYVFATHPDADHIGGLDAVISQIEVGQVLVGNGKATTKTYTDFIEAIMNRGLSPSVPLLGTTFSLGEATLKIVSVANEKDVNNCSLVILYTYGDTKVLFMGDADQSIEKSIDLNEIGDVDLIKVGHHGSKTSSNEAFIKAVNPEYAVITCGTGNKYGHPNQETLDTLNDLGIAIYRTDEMGDIVFEITKQGLKSAEHSATNMQQSENKENALSQNSVTQVEKEEAVEAFKPIEDTEESIVYFTKSGKRYHKDPTCSNMKDPVAGTLDEVGDRAPCQKCYA